MSKIYKEIEIGKEDPKYTSCIRVSENLLKPKELDLILKITDSCLETVGFIKEKSEINKLEKEFIREDIFSIDDIWVFKFKIHFESSRYRPSYRIYNIVRREDIPDVVFSNSNN